MLLDDRLYEQKILTSWNKSVEHLMGVHSIRFFSRPHFLSQVFVLDVKVCTFRGRLTNNISSQALCALRIHIPKWFRSIYMTKCNNNNNNNLLIFYNYKQYNFTQNFEFDLMTM